VADGQTDGQHGPLLYCGGPANNAFRPITIMVVIWRREERGGDYLERLFTGMLSNVRSENARSCERLAAVDTLVRTLSTMHLQTCKISTSNKQSCTHTSTVTTNKS